MSRNICDYHNWWGGVGECALGIYWIEARDAAKNPSVHRTVPNNNKYLTQNVSSAEVGKLCPNAFPSTGIIKYASFNNCTGAVLIIALLLYTRALCAPPTSSDEVIIVSWVVSPHHLAVRSHTGVYFFWPLLIPNVAAWVPWEAYSDIWGIQRFVCRKFIRECSWDQPLWKGRKGSRIGLREKLKLW